MKFHPFLFNRVGVLTGRDLGRGKPCSLISEALAQRGMLKTFSSSMDHAICQWPSSTANVRCCGDLVEDSVGGFDIFLTGGSKQLEQGGGEYEYTTIRRSLKLQKGGR